MNRNQAKRLASRTGPSMYTIWSSIDPATTFCELDFAKKLTACRNSLCCSITSVSMVQIWERRKQVQNREVRNVRPTWKIWHVPCSYLTIILRGTTTEVQQTNPSLRISDHHCRKRGESDHCSNRDSLGRIRVLKSTQNSTTAFRNPPPAEFIRASARNICAGVASMSLTYILLMSVAAIWNPVLLLSHPKTLLRRCDCLSRTNSHRRYPVQGLALPKI